MAIEAVTFDLDHTLLQYEASPDDIIERCCTIAGHDPYFTFREYMEVYEQFVDDVDSPLELRTRAFSMLARRNGADPAAGPAVAESWGAAHAKIDVELAPGAERVLDACTRGCDVGLITNGPSEAQRPKMETTGLTDRFDVEVFAADDLRFKPDPNPFETALDALDTRPEDTLHVGDSFEADVEGALDVGMQAVWITNGSTPDESVSVPRINSLGELLELADLSRVA